MNTIVSTEALDDIETAQQQVLEIIAMMEALRTKIARCIAVPGFYDRGVYYLLLEIEDRTESSIRHLTERVTIVAEFARLKESANATARLRPLHRTRH
jgi:hypothetical protein